MSEFISVYQIMEGAGIMLSEVVDALNVFSDCVDDELYNMRGFIPDKQLEHIRGMYNMNASVLNLAVYRIESIKRDLTEQAERLRRCEKPASSK